MCRVDGERRERWFLVRESGLRVEMETNGYSDDGRGKELVSLLERMGYIRRVAFAALTVRSISVVKHRIAPHIWRRWTAGKPAR